MATIATKVQWTSESPKIYFDFSYEKKREGSTQYYAITVSCQPLLSAESYYGYPINVQIFLDGVEKTSFNLKSTSPQYWSSAISYATSWLGVANKASGTTTIAIRVYSGSYSKRDVTYTYQLAVDPAASTISVASGTAIIEGYPTITIARASTSFTHTISYQFGTLKDTIVDKTSATSITNWQIPASFYSQIPNAKEGKGVLICTTYSGNTPIGSYEYPFVVGTDETKCKPSLSCSVIDSNSTTVALTGNSSVLVRYCSVARCTIEATPNKGAGSITAKTVNNISGDIVSFVGAERSAYDFYAKDSRGYSNSDKVVCTLVPYIRLTNDATVQRDDPTSGNATLEIEGNYYNGSFGAQANSLTVEYIDGGKTYRVTPTIKDNKYYAKVALTGYDYTESFNIEVNVYDKVSYIPKTLTLQKGIPVFDWGENDFRFNVPVTINGVNILEKLAELEELVAAKG